jgi:hypothetical protein
MKFIVVPKTNVAQKRITLCAKCSENPIFCA